METEKKETGELEAASQSRERCRRWRTLPEAATCQERESSVKGEAESISVEFVG